MKQVYTFSSSTGEVYLDRLSSTKEGVKQLIKDDFKEWNCDEEQIIRDILIDDKRITVVIDDNDLKESFTKVYYLVSFDVI